ncbi:unnamed protein product [Orchesella dallaii]|uniref:EGF-like domain-containing protein n=1 Tax=Orchesella dallaii TaxID=48710 RepID=A0ABP1R7P6_9HEXA
MGRPGRRIINYSPSEMSRGEMIYYFRTVYNSKITSMDETNEAIYHRETFAEDLYHNIDTLMPRRMFQKLLMKTKNITDKSDGNGISMLPNYPGVLNAKCSKDTIFNHTLHEILKRWDGDRTIIFNDIEQWHKFNAMTPYTQICNRFLGLTCQFKLAANPDIDNGKSFETSDKPTCQCSGDSNQVGFYKQVKVNGAESYPDGCYVRPWKQCRHLSLDTSFKKTYHEWHVNLENWRRQLAQIVFPVGRTHRCKAGTYCVDIVPGMKKPICYCNSNSEDPICKQTAKIETKRVPVGKELAIIRKAFVKLILPQNDTRSMCNSEYNEEVLKISGAVGHDPTKTKVIDMMKQLAFANPGVRICDFREGILCDQKTSTCKGNLNCDGGKIHLGMGVCAVNNGFQCQGNEECVEKAKCQPIGGAFEMICMCEKGYGHMCELDNPAFFGKQFLPIISGFQGEKFIKLQTDINRALEPWEETMTLNEGDGCKPAADLPSIAIVKYFGNLELYDKDKGEILMKKLSEVLQEGPKLCPYHKLLRCDATSLKCVPMFGNRIITNPYDPNANILVELNPEAPCELDVPLIFKEKVTLVCSKGHVCKKTRIGKVCAPDCNSIDAPQDACATITTTESDSSNEIESTTPSDEFDENITDDESVSAGGQQDGQNDMNTTMTAENTGEINGQRGDEWTGATTTSKTPIQHSGTVEEATKDKQLGITDDNEIDTNATDDDSSEIENEARDDPPTNSNEDVNDPTSRIDPYAPRTGPTTPTTTETTTPGTGPTTPTTPETTTSGTGPTTPTTTETTTPGTGPTTPTTTDTTTPGTGPTTPTTSHTTTPTGPTTPTTSPTTTPTGPTTPTTSHTTTPTGPTTPTTETTTDPTPTDPITPPTDPPIPPTQPPIVPKARLGQSCAYNDSRVEYPYEHKHLICDGESFLICRGRRCHCLEGLAYSSFLEKCTMPVGRKCSQDIWRKLLPPYMNAIHLSCQYGVCMNDNVGKICRPESNRGLLLVPG